MARRETTKRRPTPKQRPARQPEMSFRRFWVTKAAFQELPKGAAAEDESAPKGYPVELGIAVKVMVSEENVGRVFMTLSVAGDPRSRPYRLHLEIVGEFAAKAEASRHDVIAFCRDNGPTLLFPYARQIIDRMTSDGLYGAIRLDPMYLRQMLVEQVWKDEPDGVENASREEPSPIERERHH